MNEKKSYKIKIFEDQYTLISDESESHVIRAADIVDSLMKEVSIKSNSSDHKKIAVLAALRLADKLLNLEHIYNDEQLKKVALIDLIEHELKSATTVNVL